MFVITPENQTARDWLVKSLPVLKQWESPAIKAGGAELLQRQLKATVWFKGEPESPAVVLRRLEGYNPEISTRSWRVVEYTPGVDDTGGQESLMVAYLPESQARTIQRMGSRLYYDLGRVKVRIADQGHREESGPSAAGTGEGTASEGEEMEVGV